MDRNANPKGRRNQLNNGREDQPGKGGAGNGCPGGLPDEVREALASPGFVGRVLAMCRQPEAEEVAAETLSRLCDPQVGGRHDSSRGSVLQFASGVRRRVEMERRRDERRAGRRSLNDNPPDQASNPLGLLIVEETLTRVVALLNTLPPRDRDLVRRRFGFCSSRAGALTNTERSRVARALHLLRDLASGLDDD